MAYNPTVWANDTVPDIDATNLNKMEQGIKNADDTANAANTEVQGIRTGVDGTVYASAGDAVRGQVTKIQEEINEELKEYQEVEYEYTLTDGYAIISSGANIGVIGQNAACSVSSLIPIENIDFLLFKASTDVSGRLALYRSNYSYIADTFKWISPLEERKLEIPEEASYFRFSAYTGQFDKISIKAYHTEYGNVYTEIETKQNRNVGTENSGKYAVVDSNGDITFQDLIIHKEKRYMKDYPQKALMPEMMADFAWCAMQTPAAMTGKNVNMTVSGSEGATQVTVSDITEITISQIGTNWVGGVLSYDGVEFEVCNFRYSADDKLDIYPPLKAELTNGILSNLMYDSGTNYVGLHLTENGYKAYAQNLYRKNPKHCEVGKYIAKFWPDGSTASPFTWYGGAIYKSYYNVLRNMFYLNNSIQNYYRYYFASSYTAHTTKSGTYWEVNLQKKSGYLEAYIFSNKRNADIALAEGAKFHIDVYIDGVKVYSEYVEDCICRRVIVDYEDATTGRLEVWSDNWSGEGGWGFGDVTWWVNELKYDDDVLFPAGAVLAQEFDSWGVYHDGASGKELERLHNNATGVTVPFTNHSLGSQTTAWGLSWWYENVWKYNPAICITDFVINDTNSTGSASIPDTIEGPDGKEYNNKITSSMYIENIRKMIEVAVKNGIQPIIMRNCQHGYSGYSGFTWAMIHGLSEEI